MKTTTHTPTRILFKEDGHSISQFRSDMAFIKDVYPKLVAAYNDLGEQFSINNPLTFSDVTNFLRGNILEIIKLKIQQNLKRKGLMNFGDHELDAEKVTDMVRLPDLSKLESIIKIVNDRGVGPAWNFARLSDNNQIEFDESEVEQHIDRNYRVYLTSAKEIKRYNALNEVERILNEEILPNCDHERVIYSLGSPPNQVVRIHSDFFDRMFKWDSETKTFRGKNDFILNGK